MLACLSLRSTVDVLRATGTPGGVSDSGECLVCASCKQSCRRGPGHCAQGVVPGRLGHGRLGVLVVTRFFLTLRIWWLGVGLACCGALGSGCSDKGGSPGYYGVTRPKHGPKELWYNLGGNPEWVDPALASDSQSSQVLDNLFEGLVRLHPQTLQPIPGVAQGWRISEDGKRYLFELRSSQWSDGRPVTAYDFEYSLRRVLDPNTGSRYAVLLYPLLQAEAVNRRAIRVDVGRPVDEKALAVWAEQVMPIDRVVLTPDGRGGFLFAKSLLSAEQRQAHVRSLAALPLDGKPIALVRESQLEDVGVRALSDTVLEMRLSAPVPYWLSILGLYTAMPVPRHLLQSLHKQGIPEVHWTRPEHIVVNGPFRLTEWVFRSHLVLSKNPRYWEAQRVALERVRMLMVESYNTTLNLYRAGELDHMGQSTGIPAEMMGLLAGYRDFQRYDMLSVYYLVLNTTHGALKDVRVRRALSLALNRAHLIEYVTRGGQRATADMVPDGLAGYQGLDLPLYDPEQARELLKAAGYGPERPLPTLRYKYNTSEGHKQIAEALQQMWKAELGINVQLENEEWRVYLKSTVQGNFEIARMGWVADYADPATFLELFLSENDNNRSGWSSPEVDRLLRAATVETDKAQRLRLMRNAEALALAAQPVIPLYVYTRSELAKPYLRNAYRNAQARVQFGYMSIDERYYAGCPEPRPNDPLPIVAPQPLSAAALKLGGWE